MNQQLVPETSFALVSKGFFDAWRLWIAKPLQHPRPAKVDNWPMLCEHNLLLIDPKARNELEGHAILIKEAHWKLVIER